MNLTDNFTLEEMIHSDIADKNHIDNIPDESILHYWPGIDLGKCGRVRIMPVAAKVCYHQASTGILLCPGGSD